MPRSFRPRPGRARPTAFGALVALVTGLAAAAPAAAGEYSVRQCDYATGNHHHSFQWQWAGTVAGANPSVKQHAGSGCGEFGLALQNNLNQQSVTHPSGAYGGWFSHAPAGTYFTSFTAQVATLASGYTNMATYIELTQLADGSGAKAYPLQGLLGNDTWQTPAGVSGPVGRGWSGGSAERAGILIRCGPGHTCVQQQHSDLRIRARSFDFTLNDYVPPATDAVGGTLTHAGWRRGTQTIDFVSSDFGSGIANVTAGFDNGTALSSPSACTTVAGRYAQLAPCPGGRSGSWTLDTAHLPDGRHDLTVTTWDAGGAHASRSQAVHVDNTAPAAPLALTVAGGSEWRRANGFDLRWVNPGGQHAPIAKAHLRACPVAGGTCLAVERPGGGIAAVDSLSLPRTGEWDVRLWLEDAAGNADGGNAAPPVRLRFDPDLPPDPATIEPPSPLAGQPVAAIASLLGGTRLYAAAVKRELRPTRGCRHRRPRACRRVPTVRRLTTVRVRHGATVRIGGSLTTATGSALAERAVAVTLATTGRRVELPGALTDARGRFAYWLRMPRSGTVWLRFAGDGFNRAAERSIAVRVSAPVTARASRREALGGDTVLFSGRVGGGSLPARGKLVEVQAHFRGRWRTISTVRSTRAGRWRFAYRFRDRVGRASYRLRARVPTEGGYPFEAGSSAAVRVTVRGRERARR